MLTFPVSQFYNIYIHIFLKKRYHVVKKRICFFYIKALKQLNSHVCRNESVQIDNGPIMVIYKPYASLVIYAVTVFRDVLLHFPRRPVATAVAAADLFNLCSFVLLLVYTNSSCVVFSMLKRM